MLAKKYPELKKPIECARRMGLIESIRDYYFHKNLAKIDDLCLKEQWMIDGRAEGMAQGLAEGKAQGKAEIIALLEKGLSLEDIKKHIGD